MEKLLSAQQVADYLGMHPKTLYKALRENRIPLSFVRLQSRRIAFRPSAVEAYLAARQVDRTGGGIRKRRKETVVERLRRKYTIVPMMTDEDAARFFRNVKLRDRGSYAEIECDMDES
jgi:excisionase family DNA binding protein